MIYICIPTHDEATTVGLLLWRVRRVLGEFPRDYEVIVLDDASTDNTEEVLQPYSRVMPVTFLKNEERIGYARSVERLLREAVTRASHPRRDMAIVMQADFSDPPEEIPSLVKRVEGGVDLVSAAPPEPAVAEARRIRWLRRSIPLLFRGAALPEGVNSPLAGFRAYRLSVLKKAFSDRDGTPLVASEGWASNLELLLAVAPHARRVEGVECESRVDRRVRETRFRAWDSFVQIWGLARRTKRYQPAPVETEAAA